MIMISVYERNQFVASSIDSITRNIFQNANDSMLLFKVLAIFLDKTNNNELQLSKLNEKALLNEELLKAYYQELLTYMVNVATEEDQEVKEYSTGQLAKYFGVSITTINNWINEGKFVGFKRKESNEQARIKGNVLWKSRTGKVYPVQEIVDEWEKENQELESPIDEKVFLINQNAAYEIKYNGTYENTLGKKSLTEMSAQEESDVSVWRYFRKRLKDEYGL